MVDNIKEESLDALVVAARNIKPTFFRTMEVDKSDPGKEINRLLTYAFRYIGKDDLNKIISMWIDKFLGDEKENIVSKNPLKTVENYLNYTKSRGYHPIDVEVNHEGERITLDMNGGCPYHQFCEDTNHKKCVRGSILKSLFNGNSYFSPVLVKNSYPSCTIEIKPSHDAIEQMFDNMLDPNIQIL